jgi:hypothetical protein
MIMRIYRGTVRPGLEPAWQRKIEEILFPRLKSLPGLVAFYPGRPMPQSGSRIFCMVMVFEDVGAVASAVGGDWKQPIALGDDAEFLETGQVEHFELHGDPRLAHLEQQAPSCLR